MKIFNLPRASGKTMRLLYASEFNNAPILCATITQKQYLMEKARNLGLKIPEPISVADVVCNKLNRDTIKDRDILIDEVPMVLQNLLNALGMKGKVKAITLTPED